MSTLLLTEIFPPKIGGSGRWFWEIYSRLPHGQILVVAGEDPQQAAFDRTHALRIVRAPLALPSWGLLRRGALFQQCRMLWRLRGLVRSERVSVVHAGKCLPEGLTASGLKAMARIPYVCYVHGEELNLASQSRELAWLTRHVLRGAE
jgi:phosphatidylinositol alpha-1,6-mannosyltransferase